MTLATDNARADVADSPYVGQSVVTFTFPNAVAVGQALAVGLMDLNENQTLDSVSGSVNASGWDISAAANHTGTNLRAWVAKKISGGAGTETVTLTLSGSTNGIVGGVQVETDGGAISFDTVATVREVSGSTDMDSNTFTAAGPGGALSFVFTQSDQSVTADGAGETNVTAETRRLNITWEPYASGGTKGLESTSSTNAAALIFAIGLLEAVGGTGQTGAGNATMPAATTSGTAHRGVQDTVGAIALTGPVATLSGTGTVDSFEPAEITGTGALVITRPTVSGVGTGPGPEAVTGTGALVCGIPTVVGAGVRHITGTGALTSSRAILNGVGPGVSFGELTQHRPAHKPAVRRAIKYAHGRPLNG